MHGNRPTNGVHTTMIRLEKLNAQNVWDILKLQVSEEQRNFVADNATSIIEAYTTITANGHAFPFGIYNDDKPVGFLMIGFGVDDYWDDAPEIAKGNYNLWRLMIDMEYHDMPQKIRGNIEMMKKAAMLAYEQTTEQLSRIATILWNVRMWIETLRSCVMLCARLPDT